MDIVMVALRALHVGLGVFWAGTMVFVAVFLEPSIRATLPEGGRVQQELMRRRLFDVMPGVALLTILSGAWLYWRVSGGLDRAWLGSRPGITLTLGALLTLVAFAIGIIIARPAQLRAAALGPLVAKATGAEKDAMTEQLQALRRRGTVTLRWVATLLALATLAMGVARYL